MKLSEEDFNITLSHFENVDISIIKAYQELRRELSKIGENTIWLDVLRALRNRPNAEPSEMDTDSYSPHLLFRAAEALKLVSYKALKRDFREGLSNKEKQTLIKTQLLKLRTELLRSGLKDPLRETIAPILNMALDQLVIEEFWTNTEIRLIDKPIFHYDEGEELIPELITFAESINASIKFSGNIKGIFTGRYYGLAVLSSYKVQNGLLIPWEKDMLTSLLAMVQIENQLNNLLYNHIDYSNVEFFSKELNSNQVLAHHLNEINVELGIEYGADPAGILFESYCKSLLFHNEVRKLPVDITKDKESFDQKVTEFLDKLYSKDDDNTSELDSDVWGEAFDN